MCGLARGERASIPCSQYGQGPRRSQTAGTALPKLRATALGNHHRGGLSVHLSVSRGGCIRPLCTPPPMPGEEEAPLGVPLLTPASAPSRLPTPGAAKRWPAGQGAAIPRAPAAAPRRTRPTAPREPCPEPRGCADTVTGWRQYWNGPEAAAGAGLAVQARPSATSGSTRSRRRGGTGPEAAGRGSAPSGPLSHPGSGAQPPSRSLCRPRGTSTGHRPSPGVGKHPRVLPKEPRPALLRARAAGPSASSHPCLHLPRRFGVSAVTAPQICAWERSNQTG